MELASNVQLMQHTRRLSSGDETSSRFHLARLVKLLFTNSHVPFRHMLKEAPLSQ